MMRANQMDKEREMMRANQMNTEAVELISVTSELARQAGLLAECGMRLDQCIELAKQIMGNPEALKFSGQEPTQGPRKEVAGLIPQSELNCEVTLMLIERLDLLRQMLGRL